MISLPRCGPSAVHGLRRRIEVNELLGNADMHLKNIGLPYRDRHHATLAAAENIKATGLYSGARGDAPRLMLGSAAQHASPLFNQAHLKDFGDALGEQVASAAKVIRDVASQAAQPWRQPILASQLTPRQKRHLLRCLAAHLNLRQAINRLRRPAFLRDWDAAADFVDAGGKTLV